MRTIAEQKKRMISGGQTGTRRNRVLKKKGPEISPRPLIDPDGPQADRGNYNRRLASADAQIIRESAEKIKRSASTEDRTMSQATPQEIRLTRRQPYFMLNNSVFDSGLAAEIGPHAFSLYAYLCRRANQSGIAWPSQATMAKNTGISKRMVDKCIQTLEAANLIRRDGWNGSTREIEILDPPESIAPGATVAQHAIPIAPGADPHCTPCNTPIAPGADNKDTVDKDTMIKTQDKDTVSSVFTYWREKTKHPGAVLDAKRRTAISHALKLGYTAEQLRSAVDGCLKSPWHQGENDDGRVYDSITLIFRNAEKIEQFIGYNKTPPKPREKEWKPGRPIYIDGVRVPDHQCDTETGWVSPEFGRAPGQIL